MRLKLVCAVATVAFWTALGYGLCLLSGQQNMPWLWAVLITQGLIGIGGLFFLPSELIAERMKPKGRDQDPLGVPVLGTLCLAQLVIAVLDSTRWHASDSVPPVVQLIALIIQSLGWIGFYWSMYVNKFFSSAIRIQEDRGQKVITAGPYRYIRHPGYSFASLGFIGESIALGSWLSLLPALMMAGYMAYRTMLEEKMLRENLDGYAEYTKATRFRWIPGIW